MSAIHTGMRDPTEGAEVKAIVGVKSELERPRPSCGPCSADFRGRTGLPGKVLVERALIVRADTGGYLAIVHCHGASDVLELPPNPDEVAVAAAVAFTSRGKR